MALAEAIRRAGDRPGPNASQSEKKAYSERVSGEMALVVASELRNRGLSGALPMARTSGPKRKHGGEKRIAGGLGDKKVDVTYATDRAGLVLAISIKTISFPDKTTNNYQKNLPNRKADLAFEVTTLHKRFPYAVVGGLFFFHEGANRDKGPGGARISTFERAHQVMKIFSGRTNHRNEEAKFEYLALGLYNSETMRYHLYEAGSPQKKISFQDFLIKLLGLVAERNPEEFVFDSGRLRNPRQLGLRDSQETTEE